MLSVALFVSIPYVGLVLHHATNSRDAVVIKAQTLIRTRQETVDMWLPECSAPCPHVNEGIRLTLLQSSLQPSCCLWIYFLQISPGFLKMVLIPSSTNWPKGTLNGFGEIPDDIQPQVVTTKNMLDRLSTKSHHCSEQALLSV